MVASVGPAPRSCQTGVAMSSELQSSRVFLLCPESALLDLEKLAALKILCKQQLSTALSMRA